MTIRFIEGNPPVSKTAGGGKWIAIVAELKARPGVWAVVGEYGFPSAASRGARQLRAQHGCEAVGRRNQETNMAEVYARWPQEAS